MRKIEDILYFRSDLSPFLVHLTREFDGKSPKENLESILQSEILKASDSPISLASYGTDYFHLDEPTKRRFFGAISFTETPLNEIHCLLEITGRQVKLEQYGLVFLRECLEKRGVAPVFYLNNELGDKTSVIRGLCQLMNTDEETAEQILPLIAVFGEKLPPFNSTSPPPGRIDFRWEREWRYPAAKGDFSFSPNDIFVGLCPHSEIGEFESLYPNVEFVDPVRNIKWYATKLIAARQRLEMKYSVV